VITAPVLEIDVCGCDDREIRSRLALITSAAAPGRHVRIKVGDTTPPLWISSLLREDLFWQVNAASERTLRQWCDRMEVTNHVNS
jgi:hypothetical protein